MLRNSVCVLLAGFFLIAANTQPISGLNTEEFRKQATEEMSWSGNPFVRRVEEIGIKNLNLVAIVYRDEDRAALISGEIVRVGDKISTIEVVAIEKQHVVLRNESGVFKLSLMRKKK